MPAPPATDQAADRRQLDLFLDGGDALLIHEIVIGLVSRDVGRAEMGLHRLGREHSRHPDLVALTVLVEALTAPAPPAATHVALSEHIELTEHRLVPAARRFLGAEADAFLEPIWQMLAVAATGLPFDAALTLLDGPRAAASRRARGRDSSVAAALLDGLPALRGARADRSELDHECRLDCLRTRVPLRGVAH
jgi:hypothetical protein